MACVYWGGGGKGCCLRWCAFVQSGTVSVQPHPWFGLVVFSAHRCDPPVPPSGWGAESLSLSVSEFSSLLRTGGSQLLISPRLNDNPKPLTCPPFTYTLLSDSLQNPLFRADLCPVYDSLSLSIFELDLHFCLSLNEWNCCIFSCCMC